MTPGRKRELLHRSMAEKFFGGCRSARRAAVILNPRNEYNRAPIPRKKPPPRRKGNRGGALPATGESGAGARTG